MRWLLRAAVVTCLSGLAPCAVSTASAQEDDVTPRVAWVVGQGAYTHLGRLSNPPSDARRMARLLRDAGFALVEDRAHVDLTGEALRESAERLRAWVLTHPGARVVVVYAGHGQQWEGQNALLGIDTPPPGEEPDPAELESTSLDLRHLLAQLSAAGAGAMAVFLDACRDNVWSAPERLGVGTFPAPNNTLIAYASAPGTVSYSRYEGSRSSPFLGALREELERDPSRPLSEILPAVRTRVLRDTHGEQTPWERSSLFAPFVLVPDVLVPDAPEPEPAATSEHDAVPPEETPPPEAPDEASDEARDEPSAPTSNLSTRRNPVGPLLRLSTGGHVFPDDAENLEMAALTAELGLRILVDPPTGFALNPAIGLHLAAGDLPTVAFEAGLDASFEIAVFFVSYGARMITGSADGTAFVGLRHGLRLELGAMGVAVMHELWSPAESPLQQGVTVAASFDFGAFFWD